MGMFGGIGGLVFDGRKGELAPKPLEALVHVFETEEAHVIEDLGKVHIDGHVHPAHGHSFKEGASVMVVEMNALQKRVKRDEPTDIWQFVFQAICPGGDETIIRVPHDREECVCVYIDSFGAEETRRTTMTIVDVTGVPTCADIGVVPLELKQLAHELGAAFRKRKINQFLGCVCEHGTAVWCMLEDDRMKRQTKRTLFWFDFTRNGAFLYACPHIQDNIFFEHGMNASSTPPPASDARQRKYGSIALTIVMVYLGLVAMVLSVGIGLGPVVPVYARMSSTLTTFLMEMALVFIVGATVTTFIMVYRDKYLQKKDVKASLSSARTIPRSLIVAAIMTVLFVLAQFSGTLNKFQQSPIPRTPTALRSFETKEGGAFLNLEKLAKWKESFHVEEDLPRPRHEVIAVMKALEMNGKPAAYPSTETEAFFLASAPDVPLFTTWKKTYKVVFEIVPKVMAAMLSLGLSPLLTMLVQKKTCSSGVPGCLHDTQNKFLTWSLYAVSTLTIGTIGALCGLGLMARDTAPMKNVVLELVALVVGLGLTIIILSFLRTGHMFRYAFLARLMIFVLFACIVIFHIMFQLSGLYRVLLGSPVVTPTVIPDVPTMEVPDDLPGAPALNIPGLDTGGPKSADGTPAPLLTYVPSASDRYCALEDETILCYTLSHRPINVGPWDPMPPPPMYPPDPAPLPPSTAPLSNTIVIGDKEVTAPTI